MWSGSAISVIAAYGTLYSKSGKQKGSLDITILNMEAEKEIQETENEKLEEELSRMDIKVKVNRFDSVASVDETDAIKIGKHQLFASHQQQHPVKHVQFEKELVKPQPEGDLTAEEIIMRKMVTIDDGDVYSSAYPKRGLCLIIENDMFSTNLGLSKRKGSSIDRILMIKTFTQLDFEVTACVPLLVT